MAAETEKRRPATDMRTAFDGWLRLWSRRLQDAEGPKGRDIRREARVAAFAVFEQACAAGVPDRLARRCLDEYDKKLLSVSRSSPAGQRSLW